MRKTIALTEERKALMAAEIAHLPATATYWRCNGDTLVTAVCTVARKAAVNTAWVIKEFFTTWFLRGMAVLFMAIQFPQVAEMIDSADAKVAAKREALTYYVSGNSDTATQYMRQYLSESGYTVTSNKTMADRVVVANKIAILPRDCRDATLLKVQVTVTMPNGHPLQPFRSTQRHRFLGCDKDAFMQYLGQFVADILHDETFRYDQYFLAID